jgi:hypothetical protein
MIRIHDPVRWPRQATQAVPTAASALPSIAAAAAAAPTAVEQAPPAPASRAAVWRAQQAKGRDFVTVGARPGVDAVTQMLSLVGAPSAEFDGATTFQLDASALLAEIDEAIALPASPCVALLGPVSLLFLGTNGEDGFDRLGLLDRLLPVY